MASQAVTLHLPEPLYRELKQRAAQSRRTVEDETLDVLSAAVPVAEKLPDDLAEAISPLALLDDEALWRAARSRLANEAATELADLHQKRQREGLTVAEAQTAEALVRQYERAMLVRAQAAALLKQRGHDVSSLLTAP
jgi:plasmid stability protein